MVLAALASSFRLDAKHCLVAKHSYTQPQPWLVQYASLALGVSWTVGMPLPSLFLNHPLTEPRPGDPRGGAPDGRALHPSGEPMRIASLSSLTSLSSPLLYLRMPPGVPILLRAHGLRGQMR